MERQSRHGSRRSMGAGISKAMTAGLVLSIALLFADRGTSQADTEQPACVVDVEAKGRLVEVRGLLVRPEPAAGHYQLIVEKQGQSGRSRNMQSGSFVARNDGSQTRLGNMAFRLSPGDQIRAELTIRVQERVICTATR